MKLNQFTNYLQQTPEHELRFVLPDGSMIEAHAHITEVGRVEKRFIDCGGTVRRELHCSLQAWVADDIEHRLTPGKLRSIIEKAESILGDEDLVVEIEYQDCLISQFPVTSAESDGQTLTFLLSTKNTDCLAKDICLPKQDESCCAAGGCC